MTTNALIVDDSRLACKVLANMLEPFDIQSVAVYSAEQALDYLQSQKPDIIFLDHTMPGMDGLETIKVIKSNPMTATVPVVMYTAKQGEVYVGQARALGAVDVLPKGMEKDFLHNALYKLGIINKEQIENLRKDTKKRFAVNQQKKSKIAATEPNPVVPAKGNKPRLQQFWQMRMEPFLSRQKTQQTEEIIQFNRKQTRFLRREIHQTLENFEHAIALRMESHDDFLAAKEELVKQRQRKWVIAGASLILVLQTVIIWQLGSASDTQEAFAQVERQTTDFQIQVDRQFQQLEQQIALIDGNSRDSSSPAMTTKNEKQSLSLRNSQMEYVAEIYPINNVRKEYLGVSTTGYQFTVDSQGDIGTPLKTIYYLSENCQDDAFIAASSAHIFKDFVGRLWFVDKLAEPGEISINSKMTAGENCVAVNNEIMSLQRLQRNISLETGIDEHESMQVIFSR